MSVSSTITASASLQMASSTPILTTTFVPTATGCTENHLTMLANRGYEIWNNMPVPVAGETISDCFPTQFMTSWLLNGGGVTQPAFNPLICPDNYATVGGFTSNYIACCPSGYSLALPTVTPPAGRPAFGGTCYTPLYEATPVIVTQYGSTGVTATTAYTATATNAQAYAYPLEGFAYGVAEVASISTAKGTTSASSSQSTSSSNASTTLASSSNSSASNSSTPYVAANNGNALKIGLGVGISVFAVLLLSLGIFCLRRRRRAISTDANFETSPLSKNNNNNEEQQYVYASPPPEQPKWEMDSKIPVSPPKMHELQSLHPATELESNHTAYELQ